MLPLNRNPLIYRYWHAMGAGKFFGILAVAGGILGLAFIWLVIAQSSSHRYGAPSVDWNDVFLQFALFVMSAQVFVACFIPLGLTADTMPAERQRNTHDLFVTLPISPLDKVVGIVVGRNLLTGAIVALLVPVALVLGLAGGLELGRLIWFYVLLGGGFMLASLLGAAMTSGLGSNRQTWGLVLLFLLLSGAASGIGRAEGAPLPIMVLGPYSILRASTTDLGDLTTAFQPGGFHFFSLAVPWQVCPLVFYAFLSISSLLLAVRKFSRPTSPPSHRGGIVLFLLVFQFLVLGFTADPLREAVDDATAVVGLWYGTAFFCLLSWYLLSATPTGPAMQWIGLKSSWPARLFTGTLSGDRTPPLVAVGVMWLTVIAGAFAMDRLFWAGAAGRDVASWRIVGTGLLLLLFLLAYAAFLQAGALIGKRRGVIIGAGIVLAVGLLPLLFAVVANERTLLVNMTPMGVLGSGGNLLRGSSRGLGSVPSEAVMSLIASLLLLTVGMGMFTTRMIALDQISPRHARNRPPTT